MSTEDSYRQQIIQMLNDIANTTIVVVSNDEEFTKQCDKVFIMKEHKIIKTK
ncbi:MAG: hypothetical protein IPP81_07185 [Chitinophagaceae bacterium]|nr:hypothetical protein [Chitinophagaceae bacterium]